LLDPNAETNKSRWVKNEIGGLQSIKLGVAVVEFPEIGAILVAADAPQAWSTARSE